MRGPAGTRALLSGVAGAGHRLGRNLSWLCQGSNPEAGVINTVSSGQKRECLPTISVIPKSTTTVNMIIHGFKMSV